MTDKNTPSVITRNEPYVHFKKMKRFGQINNPETEPVMTDWYLKVDGVHNHPTKINEYVARGSKVIGYGNLDKPKFRMLKGMLDGYIGHSTPAPITEERPESVIDERVRNARKAS